MSDMDVDIDNDGLSFEIGDIFKDDGNNIEVITEKTNTDGD